MKTIGAVVLCFQLNANFPSWTSRVRSPSPAFQNHQLGNSSSRFYPIITQLREPSIPQSRSERFTCIDSAFQRGFGVHVEIHVERMTLLIGDALRIHAELAHERCVRSAHHMKIAPSVSNRHQFR